MKTILETSTRVFILNLGTTPVLDEKGKHIPSPDEKEAKDGYIKTKGCLYHATTHIQINESGHKMEVVISAEEIKRLYKEIQKVESKEQFEFWD